MAYLDSVNRKDARYFIFPSAGVSVAIDVPKAAALNVIGQLTHYTLTTFCQYTMIFTCTHTIAYKTHYKTKECRT